MPPEETEFVSEWLRKSDHDLAAAELSLRADETLPDIAAFHAQQAAEKALKGFLAAHGVPFRPTHNLVELLEQCLEVDAGFGSLRDDAAFLTRFAVQSRYPGTGPDPDDAVAADALERARKVFGFVHAGLEEHLQNGG